MLLISSRLRAILRCNNFKGTAGGRGYFAERQMTLSSTLSLFTYQCKPRGGGGSAGKGWGFDKFLNFLIKFPRVGNERSIKCVKKAPTPGEKIETNNIITLYKTNQKNISKVRSYYFYFAVIKYFLSPLASLILNNKITPVRLTVLL